ncbi:MAG: cell division protein FtsZ [Alphaproteobacteria bacterium]
MTITLSMPKPETELKPRITVVGVGGAGGNAVNNMIRSNLEGVEFIVCNTDAQALGQSEADRKVQLGATLTQGLGAGSRPEIGRAAAEEALDELFSHIGSTHMLFITAGMGGGTGTGGAPVIAQAAREQGILTVGVVTKPFHFEGMHRMRSAEAGIEELQKYVDTLIIIPNQNLFRIANEKTTFADAFKMADDVLYSGVRGVTDLIVMPGLINLDFADIRTVMSEMGKAMMGTGEAEGEERAIKAAESAISNPLLDDITMKGARGVLINITGGLDMTLFEVDEAANRIREEVAGEANILFGSTFDAAMEGKMRVSVVATGIDANEAMQPRPQTQPTAPIRITRPIPAARPAAAQAAQTPAAQAPAAMANAPKPAPEPAQTWTVEPEMPSQIAAESPMPAPVQPKMPEAQTEQPRPQQATQDMRMEPRLGQRTSFIPPRPAMPSDPAPTEQARPDPFAMADYENAGAAPAPAARRKRRSLLSLMTGNERPREATPPAARDPYTGEPTGSANRGFRMSGGPAAAMATGAVEPAPSQPSLHGLDPSERASMSDAEREMRDLEIPAFLRRQAN